MEEAVWNSNPLITLWYVYFIFIGGRHKFWRGLGCRSGPYRVGGRLLLVLHVPNWLPKHMFVHSTATFVLCATLHHCCVKLLGCIFVPCPFCFMPFCTISLYHFWFVSFCRAPSGWLNVLLGLLLYCAALHMLLCPFWGFPFF